MMMRMLDVGGLPALADDARQADEDNPRGYYEYAPAKDLRKDASWLDCADGRAVKLVAVLLTDLPADREYRVLVMMRDLEEMVASQRVMLERQGKPGGGLPPAQLAKVYESQLRKIDDWLAAQPNIRRLPVDFNRLLIEPAPIISAINDFLGGELDTAAMEGVIDPTLYRQRRAT